MEVVIGKKVAEMKNPHKRLEAYVDLMDKIAGLYAAEPHASYLKVAAERDGIPEGKDFLDRPLAEVKQHLKSTVITGIEYTIPGTFQAGGKLWRMVGEGPMVAWVRFDVALSADTLEPAEVKNLRDRIEALPSDYYIMFSGKKFPGKA